MKRIDQILFHNKDVIWQNILHQTQLSRLANLCTNTKVQLIETKVQNIQQKLCYLKTEITPTW